jgi:alcohol dehydrogenase (cytochrome c)
MKISRVLILVIVGMAGSSSLADVKYERIVGAESEPGSWLTYSGTYTGQRFSRLDQITVENVAGLRPVWVYQIKKHGLIEATPLVADGVMYLTEPPSTVTALDLRTGRPLWTWSPSMPEKVLHHGYPKVNRGVAILDDTVFVGTLDAHLVALDAKSGVVRWDVVVADNKTGHGITVAPLALDGKVIIGISGGEAGIRGFLDAYDSRSGKRLWRFWTVPGPGEPGNDSWGGESWKTGGAPTWVTGSYDPGLNLLYWGTGNPAPDWNGDSRPGDNLYSCSLLALDPSNGKLKWHFQFTPHDVHDWDSNHIPVLFDAVVAGKRRQLVAVANRNGFYYLLDRGTGEFLRSASYVKQTWAKGLDAQGRPILIPGKEPTEEGNLVYPALNGATVWFSPSYSPSTRLFYVAAREMGSHYFKSEAEYVPGEPFLGGGEQALAGDEAYGVIRALDATSGEIKWEFRLHSPAWAGLLATAGNLLFGSATEGNFFALDAMTGKPLWDFQTGGDIGANPISYEIDGKQYVVIGAGQGIFAFGLP